METESATSPAIPPPQEQHSDHHTLLQNPVNSNSISAVTHSVPKVSMDVYVSSNGILSDQVVGEMEQPSYYNYLDSQENADRFRRYEAAFKQYLMATHFVGNTRVGMFQETTIVGGESIRSSKWPCTRVYADPDFTYVEPIQLLVEEEAEAGEEEEEEGEEAEEEEEEEGEEAEEIESVDSAPVEISPGAEISPGEICNGDIVTEKNSS